MIQSVKTLCASKPDDLSSVPKDSHGIQAENQPPDLHRYVVMCMFPHAYIGAGPTLGSDMEGDGAQGVSLLEC